MRLPSLQAKKRPIANNIKAKRTRASTGALGFGSGDFFVVGNLIVGEYVESSLGMRPFGKLLSTLYHTAVKNDSLVSEKNLTVIQFVTVRDRGGDIEPPTLHTSWSVLLQHFAVLVGSVKFAFSSET